MKNYLSILALFSLFTGTFAMEVDKPFENEIRASLLYEAAPSDIKPRFVPLIITRDPYHGAESDGEEDDAFATLDFEDLSGKVHNGQWNELPFYRAHDIPGRLEPVRSGRPTRAILGMAEKFSTESFGVSEEESEREATGRVALNVIANRLSSISRSMNYRTSHDEEGDDSDDEAPLNLNSSYYHIVPTWLERRADRRGTKDIAVDQKRVAKFFRTWKAWEQAHGIGIQSDMSAARQFRRYYETGFGSIVPFQSLRNALMDHAATKKFVQEFYTKQPNDPVYLLYFDDDFGTLRPFGIGLLSLYERFIRYKYSQTGQLANIVSSAYRFATQADISIVASEIDRWLRAATASIISSAVCYPEPNMAILAQNPTLCGYLLRARFDESKNGKSKTESRDFIKDALSRGDATEDTIHFLPYGPLPTETPVRVISKSREVKAERDEEGFIKNWDKSALTFLRTMPQSHLKSHSWGQGVIATLTLNDQIEPNAFGLPVAKGSFKGERGRTIHNIAMSAVCKMFSAYSPVAPHFLNSIGGETPEEYAKNYGLYLLDYDRKVPCLYKDNHKGDSLYAAYLRAVKNTTSMSQLRCMLQAVCAGGKEDAERIEAAAKLSGRIVKNALLYYYTFPEIEGLQEARQATIMYELDQQELSLIALDATSCEPILPTRAHTITLAKELPPIPETPDVYSMGAMIKALRLPKKNKRNSKATGKKFVEGFGLHNSDGPSEKAIASYITKMPANRSVKYTPAVEKVGLALWTQSQQILFKDFAHECGYTWKDVLSIAAASPGKIHALSEYGLDSSTILQSNITVFQLFQILDLL